MHFLAFVVGALATSTRFALVGGQSSAGGDTGGGGGATGGPSTTTPTSLVTCEPASFTISGGTAPYFISILPGGQTSAAPLENLPNLNAAGPVTWTVDEPAGSSVTIQVKDSTGALGFSQAVMVQPGNDDSCVNGAAASGASSAASSATSRASSAASRATSAASSAASVASSALSGAASAASSATSAARSVASSASSAASSASAAAASNTQSAGVELTIKGPSVWLVGGVLTSLFVGALGGVVLL